MVQTNNSNLNWLTAHWCISVKNKKKKNNAGYNRMDKSKYLHWQHLVITLIEDTYLEGDASAFFLKLKINKY